MTSIYKNFLKKLDKDPLRCVLQIKNNKKWIPISNLELNRKILTCTNKLLSNDIKEGDRIIYQGSNSLEWVAWNLASNNLGAIWVPLYQNQGLDYVNYIIDDCKPKLIINSDDNYTFNTRNISNHIEEIKDIESFSGELINNDNLYDNSNLLIYSSGTTGNPKGVCLTNKNILSNLENIHLKFNYLMKSNSLNILPWAHIYGLTTELYYNLLYGDGSVAISTSKENFLKECREINPNSIYAVPKLLETIKFKIRHFNKPIFSFLIPNLLKLILGKNIKRIFVGGSVVNPDTVKFFKENGIDIHVGYGTTETSPMISVNNRYSQNLESVGEILDNLDVRIIDNEICVNGDSVMKGYWNFDNKNVFHDIEGKKFYKSGDSGYIEGKHLFYTGRINDNYKLSNGKFVNINHIESIIAKIITCNFIVMGNGFESNILVIESDYPASNQYYIDNINKQLDKHMFISRVISIPIHIFSEFYTPKLSIKRKKLEEFVLNNYY